MAGGGGAWKVAYADFVTAMMAFFMVMWLVGQKPEVKEAIAQHFSDPYGELEDVDEFADGMPPTGRGKDGKKHGEETRVTSPTNNPDDPAAGKPKILTIHESERTTVGAMLIFDVDSAELKEEAQLRLRAMLPSLAGMPHKIEIRGHCSGRPLGPNSPLRDPWQLCYARSFAVMRFLEAEGIEPQRMRICQAGIHEPFTLAEDAQKQLRNERVAIYLLNEFAAELQGSHDERQHGVPSSSGHAPLPGAAHPGADHRPSASNH